MSETVLLVLMVTAVPFIFAVLGAILASNIKLGGITTSAIQHLAAGLVIAAVSIDLVPNMLQGSDYAPVIVGFTLGATVMFFLEWILEKLDQNESRLKSTGSLLVTVGLDLTVDGFLIGVGFSADITTGILLSVALTLEILFLAISCATVLRTSGRSPIQIVLIIMALGLCMVIAAVLGAWLLSGLSGAWLVAVASFGAAALLYLVAEELLVRAHSIPDTKRASAMFFAGFLVIIIIDMAISGDSKLDQNAVTNEATPRIESTDFAD